ncbi:MAG TPA: hypothetical protein VF183_10515, partial [Acidimicrobiales bacterium]
MIDEARDDDPPLSLDDFREFFAEVWGRSNNDGESVTPFPWQLDLLQQVHEERRWPDLIDLPTGSGKTSVIDIAI